MAVLQSVRVLDLTARHGMLCAQILADLGADVEQIEQPGGAADILVESEPVGRLERLGLGDAVLKTINSALIHVSMTGFGPTGPKADWAWTDLTLMAAGGPLAIAGDEDRAPVRVGVPQAFAHVAAEAAAGVMVALRSRLRTGLGQRIDLAAQEAVMIATQGNAHATAVGDTSI